MTVIVGLDCSLTSTGYAERVVNVGTVETRTIKPNDLRGVARLDFIRREVRGLVARAKPDLVLMEGYGFGARQSHSHSLGELGGLVKWSISRLGFPIVIVPPTTLKKFVTGKGNAPKDTMLKAVYKKWKFDTDSNDIADAYSLVRFGEVFLAPTTKAHKELVKKVTRVDPFCK